MVSETVVLETILAQKDILSDLTDNEQQVLVDELETKLTKKVELEIYNVNLSTFYDIAEKNGTAAQYKDQAVPKDVWIHSGVTLNDKGWQMECKWKA